MKFRLPDDKARLSDHKGRRGEGPRPVADIGGLVIFRMNSRAIAKHVGVLTGPDSFLHAYERLGVIEEPLTHAWRRRIAFAFLFPQR